MNIAASFAHVLQGGPVELDEFEKEISRPLLMMDSPMDDKMQTDIEDIIAEALMRRSCNPIHIHLRLKQGFNPDATLTRSELNDLSTRLFSDTPKNKANQCMPKARELAHFYVRIATLRARIMQEQATQSSQSGSHQNMCPINGRLQRAYAQQTENIHTKQRENRAHFERIMRTLVLNPDHEYRCIHPQLTSPDLDALELQVQDILECGCATHELRCIKIKEAAIEEQTWDALIAELNALDAQLNHSH